MPPGKAVPHGLALSDSFLGTKPGPQWRCYEPSPWTFERPGSHRLKVTDNGLTMKAEGQTPANSRPMLCIPVDHSYELTVELETEGNTTAGLVLYYDPRCYAGVAADMGDDGPRAVVWRRGGTFGHAPADAPIRALRLRNEHHQFSVAYDAGQGWTQIQRGTDVSGYHHNVFGGFVSLRAGLVVCGQGTATFRNFRYRALR
jgi:beta-xylosidase